MSIPSQFFACVIQCRFSSQMDVFRWIINDSAYRVCAILHDRDIVSEAHDILNPDNTTVSLAVGDRVPAHYHMIIKTARRITEDSLTKRFGSYVTFQRLSDPCEYARYLTHDTFSARDKVHYEEEAVIGDTAFYSELVRKAITVDETQIYFRLRNYIERCGDIKHAVDYALLHNDIDVYKFCASHAYFVHNML